MQGSYDDHETFESFPRPLPASKMQLLYSSPVQRGPGHRKEPGTLQFPLHSHILYSHSRDAPAQALQFPSFRKPEMSWVLKNLVSHFTERSFIYHNIITGNWDPYFTKKKKKSFGEDSYSVINMQILPRHRC